MSPRDAEHSQADRARTQAEKDMEEARTEMLHLKGLGCSIEAQRQGATTTLWFVTTALIILCATNAIYSLPSQLVGLSIASGLLLTWWAIRAIRSVNAAAAGLKQIEALKGHLVDMMSQRM